MALSARPFFTSFRRTFVSRATCDADCDIADEATRLMAIVAESGHRRSGLIRLRFQRPAQDLFMAIHPPSAATVNGRRYAPPKPEMTASTIIRRNPVYPEVFPLMVSVSSHAAVAAPHQSGQTGTGWSPFNAHALSGIADIFRVIKTPRITAPDCSPDVMVADVPCTRVSFHRRGQMAASNRLSKSATAPPVIASGLCHVLVHFWLLHRQRYRERRSRQHKCHSPHPAWREVHRYAASPVPQP